LTQSIQIWQDIYLSEGKFLEVDHTTDPMGRP